MSEGIFTISLDFELAWGICGEANRAAYRENLLGARKAIPALLELFKEYKIHATWATVGFLHFNTKTELLQRLPTPRPRYVNSDVSTYQQLTGVGENEQLDPLHFAPSLVQLIRTYPFQELGTHTHSHYFCLEKGQSSGLFSADLDTMKKVSRDKYGEIPRSLVFPRNQVNEEYLSLCHQHGITAYRGNPLYSDHLIGKLLGPRIYPATSEGDKLTMRFLRLLDSYLPLTGHRAYALSSVSNRQYPMNIPASAFLSPYRKSLRLLEPLRLRKIKSALTFAAKNNSVYHLWFHPHNFGKNLEINLAFLRAVLEHYRILKDQYHFASLNMGEIADLILSAPAPPENKDVGKMPD